MRVFEFKNKSGLNLKYKNGWYFKILISQNEISVIEEYGEKRVSLDEFFKNSSVKQNLDDPFLEYIINFNFAGKVNTSLLESIKIIDLSKFNSFERGTNITLKDSLGDQFVANDGGITLPSQFEFHPDVIDSKKIWSAFYNELLHKSIQSIIKNILQNLDSGITTTIGNMQILPNGIKMEKLLGPNQLVYWKNLDYDINLASQEVTVLETSKVFGIKNKVFIGSENAIVLPDLIDFMKSI